MLLLLLLVALTSPFRELVLAIDGDGVPSSGDERARAPGGVTMKIVGGTITNIKNYPFLVSEMRP